LTVDAASFKLRFVEFTAVDDTAVERSIAEAERRTNETAWGSRYDDGINYFTAHLVAMNLRNAVATQGEASVKGPLLSEKVGPLSRQFASLGFASKLTRDDMLFAQTPYGMQYVELRDLVFATRVSFAPVL